VVIGSIQMVDLGLKMTIFKGADTYEIYPSPKIDGMEQESPDVPMERQKRETNRQRQRQMVSALSMLVVGTPLYLYHWKLIKKESKV